MDSSKLRDEVWGSVQAMNRAWTLERAPARLRDFFHRDMIAVTATDRHRLEGREACIASWARFIEAARVTRWVEVEPKVQVYCGGAAAVVSYDFEIAFEMGGRVLELGGRDTFTLVREDGRWWIVMDHFSPYPS
jgi:ketosteroid isomerase-like protein